MIPKTPIATTQAAALSRVIDSVTKGYHRYTRGTIQPEKLERLANKFHARHHIGATPSQRQTRKKKGLANAVLVVYRPSEAAPAHWLLLFTDGELGSPEGLRSIKSKPRIHWLNYELVRYPYRGRTSWTWKRSQAQQAELYEQLRDACQRHHWKKIDRLLTHTAAQPGFRGVKQQTWELQQEAMRKGYPHEPPFLFYITRIPHGEPLYLKPKKDE